MWIKIAILFLLLANSARALTTNAASASQADVANAIGGVSHGDTVNVPAGSANWSGLTINKAITLNGAGTNSTTITLTGNNTATKQASGVGNIRIQNFRFNKSSGGNASKGWTFTGPWPTGDFIVFASNLCVISASAFIGIDTPGGVLIARNKITAGWDDSIIHPKNATDSYNSWSANHSIGAADTTGKNNIYVENNDIYGGTNQGIDADDGSRVVFRNNYLLYSSFNTHGWATSSHGVRHFEVYGNNFDHQGSTAQIGNQNWGVWIRGAAGIIASNTFANLAGGYWGDKSELKFSIRGAEDTRPQGACGSVSYPVPHQLGNDYNGSLYQLGIHIFNNTGSQAWDAGWHWGNPCGLTFSTFWQNNRDYFLTKPGWWTPYTAPHPVLTGEAPPADTNAPTVAITSPTNGQEVANSPFATTGTASDDVGVTTVTLTNIVTGIGFAVSGTVSWTASAVVQSGSNYLEAVSSDAAANKATNGVEVVYTPESTPPAVAITSPTNTQVVFSASTAVTGTASDNVSVASVTLTNTTTATGFTVVGTTSWSTTAILQSGANTLEAIATDGSDNKATNSISVTYTPGTNDIFYSDFTAGDDSNDGLSGNPWKYCPGMVGWTGSATLTNGDTVYFDKGDTWTVAASGANLPGFELTGGVHYIGNVWGGAGTRAKLLATGKGDAGFVRFFADSTTHETTFEGFEVDGGNYRHNLIDINHARWTTGMTDKIKRVENCVVHNQAGNGGEGDYMYGIIVSDNSSDASGWVANVELLDTVLYDVARDAFCLYPGDDGMISNVLVRGCEVYNTSRDTSYDEGHGFMLKGNVKNSIVEYSYAHDVTSSAVFINGPETGGGSGPTGCSVRYNILQTTDNNGTIRFYGTGTKTVDIYGNIVLENEATGGLNLTGNEGSLTAHIHNNTFYDAYVNIGNPTSTGTLTFSNNIIYELDDVCLTDAGPDLTAHGQNLYYRSGGGTLVSSGGSNYTSATLATYEASGLSGDPVFKNTASLPTGFAGVTGTFTPNQDGLSLQTGSPALDAGVELAAAYNSSINSLARPQGSEWDRGAYESGDLTDDEAPTMTLLTPSTPNQFVAGSGYQFQVSVTDNVGVTAMSGYNARTGGTDYGAEVETDVWTVIAPLVRGSNYLTFSVLDAVGNSVQTNLTIWRVGTNTYTVPTITPTTVRIYSP